MKIPSGCPGSSSRATFDAPAVCQSPSNYKDTVWRIFPGAPPGGLKLQAGSFYFEPGLYWIGGGGVEITGNGSLIQSVDASTTTEGGGILFDNTEISGAPLGNIILNGASANVRLWPLDMVSSRWESTWKGLLIYQDRDYAYEGDGLTMNGNDSVGMDVCGTIYLPDGDVKVNGGEGDLVRDQVISKTFDAFGNGGDILALRNEDNIYQFTAAGLVA